jgi:hypothetical protein
MKTLRAALAKMHGHAAGYLSSTYRPEPDRLLSAALDELEELRESQRRLLQAGKTLVRLHQGLHCTKHEVAIALAVVAKAEIR